MTFQQCFKRSSKALQKLSNRVRNGMEIFSDDKKRSFLFAGVNDQNDYVRENKA
jgi:hypothetical protein